MTSGCPNAATNLPRLWKFDRHKSQKSPNVQVLFCKAAVDWKICARGKPNAMYINCARLDTGRKSGCLGARMDVVNKQLIAVIRRKRISIGSHTYNSDQTRSHRIWRVRQRQLLTIRVRRKVSGAYPSISMLQSTPHSNQRAWRIASQLGEKM